MCVKIAFNICLFVCLFQRWMTMRIVTCLWKDGFHWRYGSHTSACCSRTVNDWYTIVQKRSFPLTALHKILAVSLGMSLIFTKSIIQHKYFWSIYSEYWQKLYQISNQQKSDINDTPKCHPYLNFDNSIFSIIFILNKNDVCYIHDIHKKCIITTFIVDM